MARVRTFSRRWGTGSTGRPQPGMHLVVKVSQCLVRKRWQGASVLLRPEMHSTSCQEWGKAKPHWCKRVARLHPSSCDSDQLLWVG